MENSGENASELHIDTTIMISEMDTLQYNWGDDLQESGSDDLENITPVLL